MYALIPGSCLTFGHDSSVLTLFGCFYYSSVNYKEIFYLFMLLVQFITSCYLLGCVNLDHSKPWRDMFFTASYTQQFLLFLLMSHRVLNISAKKISKINHDKMIFKNPPTSITFQCCSQTYYLFNIVATWYSTRSKLRQNSILLTKHHYLRE